MALTPAMTGGITLMVDPSRTRLALLGVAALAVSAFGYRTIARPMPFVIYNASASAPLGFYRRVDGPIRRGDFVLARLPETVARFAAARDYLPLSVPVVKRVAALAGDITCAESGTILINGQVVTEALTADRQGRALPSWQGCRTLAPDDVFLLMKDIPASFDGRYFGPIQTSAIMGRLVPLWTW